MIHSCIQRSNVNELESNIDTIGVNNNFIKYIDRYIIEHSNIKSLVVLTDIDIHEYESFQYHNYWLIGPAYSNLTEIIEKSPSFFFKYRNAHIFMQSSVDGLYNSEVADSIYSKYCIKISQDIKNKYTWEYF